MVSLTAALSSLIPLDQIQANEFALRAVDLEDPAVLAMFDNIAQNGVKLPIFVRPALTADGKTQKTLDDGRPVYLVMDGLHRYTGAVRAKLPAIKCEITSATDAEVERQQLMLNLHRIPTKPYEYGKHLKRILGRDTTKTLLELANELNVSVEFIERRMGLGGLHKDGVDEKGEPTSSIGLLVDSGKIPLANAVELARLKPSDEQLNFVEDAITMTHQLFSTKVKARIAELLKAKQAGRDPSATVGFVPTPHFRKKDLVEAEVASPNEIAVLIRAKGITDPVEAAQFALKWSIQMDEQSIAAAKAKHEAREKERAIEVAERKKERAEKQRLEAEAAEKKARALAAGTPTA